MTVTKAKNHRHCRFRIHRQLKMSCNGLHKIHIFLIYESYIHFQDPNHSFIIQAIHVDQVAISLAAANIFFVFYVLGHRPPSKKENDISAVFFSFGGGSLVGLPLT